MDTAQWPQEARLVVKPPMEGVVLPSAATACSARPRPQKEHALNCPRCQSTDTKFCYYNNYSLSQPRYFCKTCRRYWTEGGSLRNIPVGGGSRKNKRSSCFAMATVPTSSSSSATSAKKPPDPTLPPHSSSGKNPKFHEGQDLNFAFPQSHMSGEFGEFYNMESAQSSTTNPNPSACSSAAATSDNTLSAVEFLRGKISARGLSPFVPMVMATPEAGAVYLPGFGLPDFRSNTLVSFPMGGIGGGGGYGNVQGVQDGGGRVFFPFDDFRQVSSVDTDIEQAKAHGGDPSAFWNGAGASW